MHRLCPKVEPPGKWLSRDCDFFLFFLHTDASIKFADQFSDFIKFLSRSTITNVVSGRSVYTVFIKSFLYAIPRAIILRKARSHELYRTTLKKKKIRYYFLKIRRDCCKFYILSINSLKQKIRNMSLIQLRFDRKPKFSVATVSVSIININYFDGKSRDWLCGL